MINLLPWRYDTSKLVPVREIFVDFVGGASLLSITNEVDVTKDGFVFIDHEGYSSLFIQKKDVEHIMVMYDDNTLEVIYDIKR